MPIGKEFLYERIYRDLLDAISAGTYRAGDRLPSEKELAESYGASRITSKKALEMLAEQDIIVRQPGRGSFVRPEGDRAEREAADKAAARQILAAGQRTLDSMQAMVPGGLAGAKAGLAAGGSESRQKMLGVILDSFSSDFGSDLLKSIEQECRKRNYNMIFRCTYGSIEEENLAIQSAVELGAQGLILMCAQDESYNTTIIQLSLNHFPMVLVDRQMQGISIPCIKTDNYQAARELTELLIRRGYKNLCFVSHSSVGTPTIRERYEGFVDGIVDVDGVKGRVVEISGYHPAPENEAEEYTDFDFSEIREAVRENIDCDAFLTVEYKLSILLYRTLKLMGIKREIVSFDGLERIYSEYGFIHAKQNEKEMGVRAVETIDRIIQGESVKGNICVPFRIIDPENDI